LEEPRAGYNDDWKTLQPHDRAQGREVEFQTVVDWLPGDLPRKDETKGAHRTRSLDGCEGLFERLSKQPSGMFTGRLRWELTSLSTGFARSSSIPSSLGRRLNTKPNPEGLLKIRATSNTTNLVCRRYVDDARRLEGGPVPFIGIAARANPRYAELVRLLRDEGAVAHPRRHQSTGGPPLPEQLKIQRDTKGNANLGGASH